MLNAGQDALICAKSESGREIYIGTITFATAKYINIDAIHLNTTTAADQKFYKNELTFIAPLKHDEEDNRTAACDFTFKELRHVSELLSNHVFLEQFDSKYHDAIADIKSEFFIGFYMPGVEFGRFAEYSMIVCSTSKSIYIFDLAVLGRIEKSMKEILEANVPKKIIHDSCSVADYLKHKRKINLFGVFDTMVETTCFYTGNFLTVNFLLL